MILFILETHIDLSEGIYYLNWGFQWKAYRHITKYLSLNQCEKVCGQKCSVWKYVDLSASLAHVMS